MAELTERQRKLLNLIIQEYIETATPVGSQALMRKGQLALSPATIRNEMAELEEAGYIYQPHTSAGRVPSDQGYRYFVQALLHETEPSADEQRTILHQFHQIELELDQWTQLAASILARAVSNVAMVSTPAAPECKLKRVELVPVQDSLALLVIVLHEGHVRQNMITVPEGMAEDTISTVGNKLTTAFRGLAASELRSKIVPDLSPFEQEVRKTIARIMDQVDQASYTDIIFDGLVLMLRQPEFFGSEKINQILETLQQREAVVAIAPEVVHSEGVRVMIGEEIKSPSLQECAVVIARYGTAGEVAGIVGVLGPKRMRYSRAIPAVRYVSRVMTSLLREIYS
ncbi:MAG: heat-inducible transcription repressor HrcA [Chloroflexi bacterium]|nr:heat-inducible transcription repressor HrcA [Chloroflexota bacterium]